MIKTIIAALAIAVIAAGAIAISNEETQAQIRVQKTELPFVVHLMGDYRVAYWSHNSDNGYDRAMIIPMFTIHLNLSYLYDTRSSTENKHDCWDYYWPHLDNFQRDDCVEIPLNLRPLQVSAGPREISVDNLIWLTMSSIYFSRGPGSTSRQLIADGINHDGYVNLTHINRDDYQRWVAFRKDKRRVGDAIVEIANTLYNKEIPTPAPTAT